ncbi:MAG: hypothetical protein ABI335_00890 [Polyangiaceae bacterium]
MASCKEDCEALMSTVLPVAEQMLTEHRELQPFGSTMSRDGAIVQVGGWRAAAHASDETLLAEFETSFRDGAARGELNATARLSAGAAKDSVLVRLDHREAYSIIVTFPFHFTDAGELVIDEPFAGEGAYEIFGRLSSAV